MAGRHAGRAAGWWSGRSGSGSGSRGRGVALVVAVALMVVATPPGLAGPAEVPAGALFGAHVKAPAGEGPGEAAVAARERQVGGRLAIDHHFYEWDDEFPTLREVWDLWQGRVPLISWDGAFTLGIELGLHDQLLQARADAVRTLSGTVFIRWMWEMDDVERESDVVHPDRFIAAWRHIHDVFGSRGATNVKWVWCPSARSFRIGKAELFYPGDDYVDWVCAEGYNYASTQDRGWYWFSDIFGEFYKWGVRRDKPMMVAAFGSLERSLGEKAVWLKDARESIKLWYPAIRAVVYFDADQDGNWSMDSSPESLDEFTQWVADPYFQVDPAVLVGH